MILQAAQCAALTIPMGVNCVNAVKDLEVAGEALHRWGGRSPFTYPLF